IPLDHPEGVVQGPVRSFHMRPARAALLVAGLALGWPALPSAFADVRYETAIAGVNDDTDLADLLDSISNLKTLEDRRPASEEMLRRRADEDIARLTDAAHSQGYWDAQFSYEIDTSADPAKVSVTAQPGPQYHVGAIAVLGPGGKPLAVSLDPETTAPLKTGDPARAASVVAYEGALLAALGHAGHPFAKAADRQAVVDHAA